MLVSYVLRLVPEAAAEGRLVGELEAVLSGTVSTVHDVGELVELIRSDLVRQESGDTPPAPFGELP